jgi:hypothetical protein
MNKILRAWVLTSFVLIAFDSFGQSAMMDSLRYEDRMRHIKKRAWILQYMGLNEAEKSSFWPVFESYHLQTQWLEMETIYLHSLYVRDFNTLGKNKLEDLSTKILDNNIALARIRKQFFKKFKKALSSQQACTFMHLDNTFRTMMLIDAQKLSPAMLEALYAQTQASVK